MLYLVATPIGNLADITLRSLEILKSADYILCEDTRHSKTLLSHYSISTPLKSFHLHNERLREEEVIADLKQGKTIALISDAGTPGISDPGSLLIKRCVEEEISVSATPGACAAITALICSGFDTTLFQFCGFLPKKQSELKRSLQTVLEYPGTSICYESPHRILELLKMVNTIAPTRRLCIAREMTKKFEEICRGTAVELLERWGHEAPRGEFVFLIEPAPKSEKHEWDRMTPQEHVEWIQSTYHVSKQEAIKTVATLRGVPKRVIYNEVHE